LESWVTVLEWVIAIVGVFAFVLILASFVDDSPASAEWLSKQVEGWGHGWLHAAFLAAMFGLGPTG
jgi:hypothetical protein